MKRGPGRACKVIFAFSLALCAGCASMPAPLDGAKQAPPDSVLRERRERLLAQPLSQDAAAELALLHPALAPHFAALRIDAASRLRMAHAPAPGATPVAAESKVERTPTLNLASWLIEGAQRAASSPVTGDAARDMDAAIAAIDAIGDWVFAARRAWVSAIAARQALQHAEEAASLSGASHELALTRRQAGNAAAADTLQTQLLHQQTMAQKARRDADARLLREQLHYRTGIWGAAIDTLRLADRLPELPPSSVNAEGMEAIALSQRVDLQAARAALALHEPQAAATPAHEAHQAMLDAAALRARMEIRSAWISYRSRLELARHACDVLLPLAQRIAEEKGKRYNGMLVSVFDLLAVSADRIDASARCSAAQSAYWLADVDLQQALAGMGRVPAAGGLAQEVAPSSAGLGHEDSH